MNERIRQLVKQAGGHFSTRNLMSNPVQHRESIELWDKNIEKFAELIVRECIGILEKEIASKNETVVYNQDDWDKKNRHFTLLTNMVLETKEHFGVEE